MTAASPPPTWIVVTNRRAGGGKWLPELRSALDQCALDVDLRIAESGRSLKRVVNRAARDAKEADALLVLHGGDGTLNYGVQVALQEQIAIGMLPGGTFNYYTRELGLPNDLGAAVQAIANGQTRPVTIATVNDAPFLLNVSLGLHSRLLRERERDMQQLGRSRWVAAWSTAKGLLRRQSPVKLRLVDDQNDTQVRAAALTVIRNPIQLEELGLPTDPERKLALMISAAQSRWELLRAALHLHLRRPHAEPTLQTRASERFELHATSGRRQRRMRLSIDGESRKLKLPLRFELLKDRLRIQLPQPG